TRVATSLLVVSGGSQTGFVTENLAHPFVVEVRAQDNLPMAGVPVNFAATAGAGSIAPTSAVTDAAGRAQATMTLGAAAGTNAYQASVSGLTPVSVTGSATVKAAASVRFGNYSFTMNVGGNHPSAATVRASDNTVLDTVSVTYTSRTTGVATVGSTGVVSGVARGQAVIVASVTSNPALKDSLLAIVATNGSVVLVSSIDRFDFPKDTTF